MKGLSLKVSDYRKARRGRRQFRRAVDFSVVDVPVNPTTQFDPTAPPSYNMDAAAGWAQFNPNVTISTSPPSSTQFYSGHKVIGRCTHPYVLESREVVATMETPADAIAQRVEQLKEVGVLLEEYTHCQEERVDEPVPVYNIKPLDSMPWDMLEQLIGEVGVHLEEYAHFHGEEYHFNVEEHDDDVQSMIKLAKTIKLALRQAFDKMNPDMVAIRADIDDALREVTKGRFMLGFHLLKNTKHDCYSSDQITDEPFTRAQELLQVWTDFPKDHAMFE